LSFGAESFAQEAAAPPPAAEAAPAPEAAPAEAAPAEAAAPAEEAAPADTMDKGDVAWMMTATVLVLLMIIPGLGLFYGGLVRAKNMLSVLMQISVCAAIGFIAWAFWGYSLAFSDGPVNQIVGGTSRFFLSGITADSMAATFTAGVVIPEFVFVAFQATFAAITAALVLGSTVERIRFHAVVVFALLWPILSYYPIAHMVWYAGGYLFDLGALDFAGGTVVHINAGVSGLVGAIVLGRRHGYKAEPMPPHSLVMTLIGAGLLWVGWFGFNAGSNLEATGGAGLALINTLLATAAAGVSWVITEWVTKGKPSMLGFASGLVAGLVAITPACGFAGPIGGIVLGLVVSPVCLIFCSAIKGMFGYDDSLDVFGIHAVGGIIGAIGTGIVVNTAFGGTGYGDKPMLEQVTIQATAVGISIAWSAVAGAITFIICRIIGGKESVENQQEGLDIVQHGEAAYHA
jgi:Amt family ammonium transporter